MTKSVAVLRVADVRRPVLELGGVVGTAPVGAEVRDLMGPGARGRASGGGVGPGAIYVDASMKRCDYGLTGALQSAYAPSSSSAILLPLP
jgi:hypothetical protein